MNIRQDSLTKRANSLSETPFGLGYPSVSFLNAITFSPERLCYDDQSYLNIFRTLNNYDFNKNSILTNSASESILISLLTVLPFEGTLLIPEPNLDLAIEIIQMTRPDIHIITVTCMDDSIEPITNALMLNPEIDAIYISSPNNPLGYYYSLEQLTTLIHIASNHSAYLIVDQSMLQNNPFKKEIPLALNSPAGYKNCLILCDSSKIINHKYGKSGIIDGDLLLLKEIKRNLDTRTFQNALKTCSELLNFDYDPDRQISTSCRINFFKAFATIGSLDSTYIEELNTNICRNFFQLKGHFHNHPEIEILNFQAGSFAILHHKIPECYDNIEPHNNAAGIIQLDCFFEDRNPYYRNFFRIPLNRTKEEFNIGLSLIEKTLEFNQPERSKQKLANTVF